MSGKTGRTPPLVSVVIPTFNRARLLKRAVRSVLHQTYREIELIIVDDGSTDHTADMVRRLADPRIKYAAQKNKGLSAALNRGIVMSRGDFLAFLDDDDEWLPRKTEVQMDAFRTSSGKVGLVYTAAWFIPPGRKRRFVYPRPALANIEGNIRRDLFSRADFMNSSSVMIRKECFKKVGLFDEQLRVGQDKDMWFRISRRFFFKYIPHVLVKNYLTPQSLSRARQKDVSSAGLLLRRYEKEYRRFGKERFAYLLCRLGTALVQQKKVKDGRACFQKAVEVLYEMHGRS